MNARFERYILPVYTPPGSREIRWVVATYDRMAREGWQIIAGPFAGRGNLAVHFALLDGGDE